MYKMNNQLINISKIGFLTDIWKTQEGSLVLFSVTAECECWNSYFGNFWFLERLWIFEHHLINYHIQDMLRNQFKKKNLFSNTSYVFTRLSQKIIAELLGWKAWMQMKIYSLNSFWNLISSEYNKVEFEIVIK